jgi:uncharacterized surface protein with fasciclin (FAS1) repeats
MKQFFFAALLFACALMAVFCTAGYAADKTPENTYDILSMNKNLEKFTGMIDDASLQGMFKNGGQAITVFAPTDDAINAIPRDTMKRIKANNNSLQTFVKYHVIMGSRVATGAINGRTFSSAAANGENVVIDGSNEKAPAKVNDAHIIGTQEVGSGVVHTISAALIPASLQENANPETPAAPTAKKGGFMSFFGSSEKAADAPSVPAPAAPTPPAAPVIPVAPLVAATPMATSKAAVISSANISSAKTLPIKTTGPTTAPVLNAVAISSAKVAMPIGSTTVTLGTTIPVSTPVPVTPNVTPPPAATPEAQKPKGFELFGHSFFGGN